MDENDFVTKERCAERHALQCRTSEVIHSEVMDKLREHKEMMKEIEHETNERMKEIEHETSEKVLRIYDKLDVMMKEMGDNVNRYILMLNERTNDFATTVTATHEKINKNQKELQAAVTDTNDKMNKNEITMHRAVIWFLISIGLSVISSVVTFVFAYLSRGQLH